MLSRIKLARLLVALFLVSSLSSNAVFAQTPNLSSSSAAGIQVSPVFDEFNIAPGETLVRDIDVASLTNNTLTYYPVAINFEANPETGEPEFLSDSDSSSKYALASWII